MKKTIKEWLEDLPDPIRSEALANLDNYEPYMGDKTTEILSIAIGGAFCWSDTPQREQYWINIQKWAHAKEDITELKNYIK